MKNRTDFYTGIVLALFAIWYFVQAGTIRIFPGMGKAIISSQTMPKLWAVCLMLLAAVLISRPFRKSFKADREAKLSFSEMITKNSEVILTFVALFVYAGLLSSLGFIISTALYVFAQNLILTPKEDRSYLKAALLGIVSSVAAFCIFVYWLDVLLPVGTIFD